MPMSNLMQELSEFRPVLVSLSLRPGSAPVTGAVSFTGLRGRHIDILCNGQRLPGVRALDLSAGRERAHGVMVIADDVVEAENAPIGEGDVIELGLRIKDPQTDAPLGELPVGTFLVGPIEQSARESNSVLPLLPPEPEEVST